MNRSIARVVGLLLLLVGVARATLKPEQIALVVNSQVPESEQLARFYAKARGVPESQIIPIDLPSGDEIIFDSFEQIVRPQIRQWLLSHGLQNQIRCLVTMYGLPLRIGDRVNSPRENNEARQLESLHRELLNDVSAIVTQAEAKATEVDPTFVASKAAGDNELLQRLQNAMVKLQTTAKQGGPTAQAAAEGFGQIIRQLRTPITTDNPLLATTQPTTQLSEADAKTWAEKPYDDEARAALRTFIQQKGGVLELTRLVGAQMQYLVPKATAAAFDSELALLWWPTYPHANWLNNPLYPNVHAVNAPPVLMTMRLDAPTPQQVRDMIANSVLVERDGLTGKIVVDSRGLAAANTNGTPDPYGLFDQRLKQLATMLKSKTTLPVVFDDKPDVLPPGSVDDVAVYVGWYSVRHYVPGMKFARGAVGYHVASFELMNLRNPRETGWVRGLINDGVVATEGPVAEPYLHSFPVPEYFFPLLLSGRLTYAEVYWSSTPLVSWMQAAIGDPLYTPFAKQPAMKFEDLAPELQQVIKAHDANGR